jgi:hypothetical protein
MTDSTARPLRCAVYNRKSTEHNLDLAFTFQHSRSIGRDMSEWDAAELDTNRVSGNT